MFTLAAESTVPTLFFFNKYYQILFFIHTSCVCVRALAKSYSSSNKFFCFSHHHHTNRKWFPPGFHFSFSHPQTKMET